MERRLPRRPGDRAVRDSAHRRRGTDVPGGEHLVPHAHNGRNDRERRAQGPQRIAKRIPKGRP
jgi:hypothetical protein